MAADEVLLEAATTGVASLRFYGWSPATLSLGYFQAERLRLTDPLLAKLPFVRRPSGGDTLVHDRELTYALALPAELATRDVEPWARRMHRIIAAALARFGITAHLHQSPARLPFSGPLCFQHFTPGDLLVGDAKIAGSAQRRHRSALLQHGAVLLSSSPHTPSLPGLRELTGVTITPGELASAIVTCFQADTAASIEAAEWALEESQLVTQLVREKYSSVAWNSKR